MDVKPTVKPSDLRRRRSYCVLVGAVEWSGVKIQFGTTSQTRARSSLLRHIGALLALLVGLQCIYFACNLAAELIPKTPLEQRIEESQDDPLIQRRFDNHFRDFGSQVSYDNNRFIKSLIEKDGYSGNIVKASVMDTIDYDIGDSTNRVDYFRYWHGWQLLAFTCLYFGPINVLSFVVALIVIASTLWFTWELRRYLGWPSALAFSAVAFFATNLFGNFAGDLLLALSVFALVACCAAILHWGRRMGGDVERRVDFLCLAAGSVFCFLDFFTVPSFALALGVFSSLIATGVTQSGFKRGAVLCVRYTVLFGIGFAGTWVAKWLLAACFIGLPAVWENVVGEMGFWSQSNNAALAEPWYAPWLFESHPRVYAVFVSFYNMLRDLRLIESVKWNPAGLAAAFITAACLLAYAISLIRDRGKAGRHAHHASAPSYGSGVWAALLPVLFVPCYAFIAWSHTVWHVGIFGYKPWAIFMAIIASLALFMAYSRRGAQGCAPTEIEVENASIL